MFAGGGGGVRVQGLGFRVQGLGSTVGVGLLGWFWFLGSVVKDVPASESEFSRGQTTCL